MNMTYEVHSEPSGGHWVAWITDGNSANPAGSAILVGKTQEEAEKHALMWAKRLNEEPHLLQT